MQKKTSVSRSCKLTASTCKRISTELQAKQIKEMGGGGGKREGEKCERGGRTQHEWQFTSLLSSCEGPVKSLYSSITSQEL